MSILIVVGMLLILILLAVGMILSYNGLVVSRNKVRDSWAQIEVMLTRRFDLIPNMVETAKGYSVHEQQVFSDIARARQQGLQAHTREEEIAAAGNLSHVLSRLMMLVEQYPNLKADTVFMNLQAELKTAENKLEVSRMFYNDTVYKYMNKLEMFPTNIFAGLFKFEAYPYFNIEEEKRENPTVTFS